MGISKFFLPLIAALVVCAPARFACGDDPGFFPKGFAGSPLQNKNDQPKKSRQRSSSAAKVPGADSAEPNSESAWDDVDVGDAGASSSSSADAAPNIDDPAAMPLLAIDGVVNFADTAHAKDIVKDMIAMTEEHHLHFRKLYAIGPLEPVIMSLDAKHRDAFYATVGRAVEATKPPEDLALKGSPSWIFYTARGRYIAEGLEALERVTTVSGKLLWPNRKEFTGAASSAGANGAQGKNASERMHALAQKLQAHSN